MTFTEWQAAIVKASEAGAVSAPEALLLSIEAQADPIRALTDWDLSNTLFASLHGEYPFFRRLLPNEEPLPEAENARGVGVLRWLIDQFRGWSAAADPKLVRFVALVVIIESCPWDSAAWFLLDDKLFFNADLVQRLKEVFPAVKIDISVHDRSGNASTEEAARAQLKAAESAADWKSLLLIWRRAHHFMPLNSLLTQAARYLYRHDLSALVQGTAGVQSIALAHQVLNSLTVEEAFHFASLTDNHLLQLMAVERAFQTRPSHQPFSKEEEQSLRPLLKQIAFDEKAWSAFLGLYNEHPSWYLALQPLLGETLITAPESALDAYVQSMALSAPCDMADRLQVAATLAVFRDGADDIRRRRLWTKAYRRWSAWNFKRADGYLLEPTFSELDYAVVGYLRECVGESERIAELDRIEKELALLNVKWFPTVTDLYTERNCLISRFRQYSYSLHTSSEENWLADSSNYQPSGPSTLYVSLRFSLKGSV